MKPKLISMFVMFLLVLPFVFAEPSFTFKQNTEADIKLSCLDEDNNFCDANTNCTITINNPEGINIVNNLNMTRNPAYYNYSVDASLLYKVGEYPSIMQCIGVLNSDFVTFTFDVTASGDQVKGDGANIPVAIFTLLIPILLILFPLLKKDLVSNKYTNLIIRRSLIVLGLFFLTLASSIMSTIVGSTNIGLVDEMFFYMKAFGWAGYLMMAYLTFKTLIDFMKEWKIDKHNKRFGTEEDDD